MSRKVLVVDDEKLIVKGIRFSLEQDGMEVDCAYDGEEAVEKAKEKKYDIILLDLMLPKMDGLEVCQQIREFSNVPIVMLTAKGEDMDKILGLEYGADDYITKPFNILEVKARIKAIMRRAGSDHRKYIRQVFVSVDITAPMYWWKEYDTYKVATVANSTSTMHKIHSKAFELDDFSHDHMTPDTLAYMQTVVDRLEQIRLKYMNEGKNKEDWYDMIQLLPSSYNQMRTCTLNYETLINIYFSRKNHKLDEWHTFCDWIKTLPYAKELILAEEEEA